MLEATGHGYLSITTHAGLALAMIGLAGVFLAGLGGAAADGPVRLAGRVSAFQILIFAAIEIAERVAAHAPLGDLTRVVPVGTIVQIGVAIVVAAVIRLLLRAADGLAEVLAARPSGPPAGTVGLVAVPAGTPRRRELSPLRGRAPPR
jgi:hypothetical protein